MYPGHDKMVDALVDGGADVNLEDDEGETPLFIAAAIGKYDIFIRFILKYFYLWILRALEK